MAPIVLDGGPAPTLRLSVRLSDNLAIRVEEGSMGMSLSWGRHYVMVEPTHFRVDYVINPFMDPTDQPDPALAMAQWRALVATIERCGATVSVLPQRADAPDMVYAMNLGLGSGRRGRHPAGRDVPHALPAAPDGDRVGAAVVRRAAASRRRTSVATGSAPTSRPATRSRSATRWSWATARAPRSSRSSTSRPTSASGSAGCGSRTRGCTTSTWPSARSTSAARWSARPRSTRPRPPRCSTLVPEPLVLTEEEALTTFCANSIVIGRTVVMPACPDRVRAQLEEWGFEVVDRRRVGVPQGRRLDPLPDQPRRRHASAGTCPPSPAARSSSRRSDTRWLRCDGRRGLSLETAVSTGGFEARR